VPTAHLYSLTLSNAGVCAALALERKGVDFELTNLPPGLHPALVRALGYRRNTVPALRIDGTRIQGSREICAYLERTRPEPPLFGHSPQERERIEAAERWGEEELQALPRRLFRYAAVNDPGVTRWLAGESGLPAPGLTAKVSKPIASALARAVGATESRVREDLAQLPDTLDRIDALIADGTIGGLEPNAADFQILPSVRSLEGFPELAPMLRGRPSTALAQRIVPPMPGPLPTWIPPAWLPAGAPSSSAPARGR
jgi:glutathione S-transferase